MAREAGCFKGPILETHVPGKPEWILPGMEKGLFLPPSLLTYQGPGEQGYQRLQWLRSTVAVLLAFAYAQTYKVAPNEHVGSVYTLFLLSPSICWPRRLPILLKNIEL